MIYRSLSVTLGNTVPVQYQITFKTLLLTFKAHHNLAPTYLSDHLPVYGSSNLLCPSL